MLTILVSKKGISIRKDGNKVGRRKYKTYNIYLTPSIKKPREYIESIFMDRKELISAISNITSNNKVLNPIIIGFDKSNSNDVSSMAIKALNDIKRTMIVDDIRPNSNINAIVGNNIVAPYRMISNINATIN